MADFFPSVDTSTLVALDGTSIPKADGFHDAWTIVNLNAGTVLQSAGVGNPTAVGGSTFRNPTGNYSTFNTTAVINTDVGWEDFTAPGVIVSRDILRWWGAKIHTGPFITDTRIWVGLFASTPMAATDPAIHGAGFRYSTDVDGTAFWRCWSNDGAGAGTVTTTTAAIAANSSCHLFIDQSDSAAIRFYVDGTLVATHSTDLPALTTLLGRNLRIRNLAAAAKDFRVSHWNAKIK